MAHVWVLCCSSYLRDDCLLGLSQLKHLDTLELPSNNIKAAACLTPLPVNLRALDLSNNPGWDSSCATNARLDITAALAQAHPTSDELPASTGVATSSTPAASLESLDISGLMLSQPSVLRGLTNLTTLHVGGLHSPDPNAILAMVHSMPKLSSLDISLCYKSAFGMCEPNSLQYNQPDNRSLQNPALGTGDIMQLVLSCPDLQSLSIAIAPTPESSLSPAPCSLLPLQQLSCLTELALWAPMGCKMITCPSWQHCPSCMPLTSMLLVPSQTRACRASQSWLPCQFCKLKVIGGIPGASAKRSCLKSCYSWRTTT